jgi:hypothetical protein
MQSFCIHYTTEVFNKVLLEKTLTIHVRRKYPKGGLAIPEQGVAFHNPHLEKQATETGRMAGTFESMKKVYPNDIKATVAKKSGTAHIIRLFPFAFFYSKKNPGTPYPIGSCKTQALR